MFAHAGLFDSSAAPGAQLHRWTEVISHWFDTICPHWSVRIKKRIK